MRRGAALALSLAAATVLAVWRAASLFADQPRPLPPTARMAEQRKDSVAESRSAQSSTLTRSLFAAPRSTEPGANPGVNPTKDTKIDGKRVAVRLVGVVSDGPERVALVAYNGAILRLREKRTFGEWTIVRIDARSALIRSGSKSELLWLDAALSKGVIAPESQ